MIVEKKEKGRKKLPLDKLRSEVIRFRVNVYENEMLKHLADSESLEIAHYIREKLLGAKPPKYKLIIPELNQHGLKQLSTISNNLNQIARKLNSDKYSDNDIALIKKYLSDLSRTLTTSVKKETV